MGSGLLLPKCITASVIVHCIIQVRSVEVISDILGEEKWNAREGNGATEEIFWDKITNALRDTDYHKHDLVLGRAETAISELDDKNSHVRDLLKTATELLRKVHQILAHNTLEGRDLLPKEGFNVNINHIGHSVSNALFSLPSFNLHESSGDALRTKRYDNLAKILKVQDTSVLSDLRLATKSCFDAVKYDIYNEGVPKSPKHLAPLAYELVDVSTEMRKSFLGRISKIANAITEDMTLSAKDASKIAVAASVGDQSVRDSMDTRGHKTPILVEL